MSAAIDSICNINGSGAGVLGATARLHQFARLLRDNGFTVSHRDVADAVRYLATMVEHREIVLRRVLRALFCSRAPELARFDEIFDACWLSRVGRRRRLQRQGICGQERGLEGHGKELSGGARGLLDYLEWSADLEKTRGDADEHGVKEEGSATRLGGASHRQGATTKDFGRLVDPVEREKLLALAERLGARMRYRIARRRKVRAKGRSVDLRKSIRHSLATGGFP